MVVSLCIITHLNKNIIARYCRKIQNVFMPNYNFIVLFDARKNRANKRIWNNVNIFEITWPYLKKYGITSEKCKHMSNLSSQGSTWFGICYASEHSYEHCFVLEDDVTCSSAKKLYDIIRSYEKDESDLICSCPPMFANLEFFIRYKLLIDIQGSECDKYENKYFAFTFMYRISKKFATFLLQKYSKKGKDFKLCHHEVMMPTECINNKFKISSIAQEHVSRWGDGMNPFALMSKCKKDTLCHPDKYWNQNFHKKCVFYRIIAIISIIVVVFVCIKNIK